VNIARLSSLVSAAVIVAACAKNPKPATEATATSASASAVAGTGWSGNIQPKQAQTSAVAPTNSQRTYGSVSIAPKGADLTHLTVHIEVNTTENASVQALAWSIYPGRCGSSAALAAPVLNPSGLPRIDLRNSAGSLTTEIEVQLTRSQQYHINMFRETPSADASRIIACANLRPN
jgi:hypothetical protein